MKTTIITILALLSVAIFVQAYIVQNTEDTEQQEYEVIETEGQFEIRYYPSAAMASVNVVGDYGSSSGNGFRILAGYIFGSNSEDQNIAMTAPVHMHDGPNGYQMSFVMPSGFDTTNLPLPDNGQIRIHNSTPAYTATVRFDGFANDEKIEAHKQELATYLNDKGVAYSEPFVFLGYNPPYQMVDRRNEVMVRIEYKN